MTVMQRLASSDLSWEAQSHPPGLPRESKLRKNPDPAALGPLAMPHLRRFASCFQKSHIGFWVVCLAWRSALSVLRTAGTYRGDLSGLNCFIRIGRLLVDVVASRRCR